MLKHVQISPLRNRADSVSIRSSISCSSSICGSPEPPSELQRTPSRASSYSSLNDPLPQTTIKVFTNCLKIDIEYKTLGIQWDTNGKEVIAQLLRRLKMRHRDPRLFYLSMEVTVRRAGVKTILVLDDDARPAILQACHPKGDSRFCLQLKPGGLIRVHTSALNPASQYKCLVISEETTSDELLTLLLSCYNSLEPVEQFSLYEVCPGQEYQRKLHPDDIPLRAQAERIKKGESCHFLVRRNPNYPRRRQLLTSLNDTTTNASIPSSHHSLNNLNRSNQLQLQLQNQTSDINSNNVSSDSLDSQILGLDIKSIGNTPPSPISKLDNNSVCKKCRNTFKSCEFCHKNSALIPSSPSLPISSTVPTPTTMQAISTTTTGTKTIPTQTYNPVYNIREIRTVSHSFSSLGIDKKLLDIQLNARMNALNINGTIRPNSIHLGRTNRTSIIDSDLNGNSISSIAGEVVKNNPSKGLGHFVYI